MEHITIDDKNKEVLSYYNKLAKGFWGDVFFSFYMVYRKIIIIGSLLLVICVAILYIQNEYPYQYKQKETVQEENVQKEISQKENVQKEVQSKPKTKSAKSKHSQAITQKAINARWDNPNSYILPNSNKKKLSRKKLNKLNLRTIQFAIDELCARHGRRFDDKVNTKDYGDMKDYFESKKWYQAIAKKYKPRKFDNKIRKRVFNEIETYNFFLLAQIRDKKKGK